MTIDALIQSIEAFAARRGWQPATVTSRAVQNSRLYARMKAGGGCTLRTAEKLRAWMEADEAAEAAKASTAEPDLQAKE